MSERREQKRPSKGDQQLADALGAVADLNDAMQQLQVGLKTTNAIARLGAEPRQVYNGTSQRISNSVGRLAGFSLRETSGTDVAVVRLRDGIDANGDLLATISLAAAESVRDWFLPGGIAFGAGCYVEIVSGEVEGVIYLGTTA